MHKEDGWQGELKHYAPDGINVHFENVNFAKKSVFSSDLLFSDYFLPSDFVCDFKGSGWKWWGGENNQIWCSNNHFKSLFEKIGCSRGGGYSGRKSCTSKVRNLPPNFTLLLSPRSFPTSAITYELFIERNDFSVKSAFRTAFDGDLTIFRQSQSFVLAASSVRFCRCICAVVM